MKVYSHYNIVFNTYPVQELICAKGADGEVFKSGDNIIKFVVISDSKKNATDNFMINKRKIQFIMDKNPKHFVKVFDFGLVSIIENERYNIVYYYLMESLNKISDDEKKLFHTILSHEDSNKVKSLNCEGTINELHKFLDFDKEKVIQFINSIKNSKIHQLDCHPRNIMKDRFGSFKFIDLERLRL